MVPPKSYKVITDSHPLKGFQHFVEIIPQRIQDVLKDIGCVCVAEEFKRHLRLSVPIIIKPYFGGNSHCDVSITAKYCFMLKLFFLFMLTQLFPSSSQKLIETQSPKLTHHHLSSFISVLFFPSFHEVYKFLCQLCAQVNHSPAVSFKYLNTLHT